MAFKDPEAYRAYMRQYMARRRAGEPPVRPSVKPDDVKPCVNPSDHDELVRLRAENVALRAEVERLRADVKPDDVKPNESVEPNLLRAEDTPASKRRVWDFGTLGVGETRFYPHDRAAASSASRAFGRAHKMKFATKKVEGGTEVTLVAPRPVPRRRNRSEAGAPDAEGGESGTSLRDSAEISTGETSEDAALSA